MAVGSSKAAELFSSWVGWTMPFHHYGGQNAGHEIIGESSTAISFDGDDEGLVAGIS